MDMVVCEQTTPIEDSGRATQILEFLIIVRLWKIVLSGSFFSLLLLTL